MTLRIFGGPGGDGSGEWSFDGLRACDRERGLICSVHGDDFTTAGPKREIDWFKEQLEKRYAFKENCRLGQRSGADKEDPEYGCLMDW